MKPGGGASSCVNGAELKCNPQRACAGDAPCARERGARLQADESVPGSKCVWRASHGLDRPYGLFQSSDYVFQCVLPACERADQRFRRGPSEFDETRCLRRRVRRVDEVREGRR